MLKISLITLFACLLFMQGCAKQLEMDSEPQSALSANRSITVQGQARIKKGAKLLARKQAFRNALSHIYSQVGSAYLKEAVLGSTKVVDEWIVDDIYHLQVLAVLSEGEVCNSPYKKRLVVTGFPSVIPGQISANESQDIYSGIPREIMNVLMETGGFIGQNKTHTVLFSRPDMAPELLDSSGYQDSVVVQVAQQQGAQFVIAGVIRDLEVESTDYIRGAGVFSRIKSMMRDFVARRSISIDIYVYDGITGGLLFQHRYTDTVLGDVWIPSGYTVGSERFKSTPTGHKISKIIQVASKDIGHLLACYPFSTTIKKVVNNKIYIPAGSQDKIKQGDSLVVYALNSIAGMQENELIGVITIQSVQATFSVGKMEVISDTRQIKAGDLVKSW